MRALALARQLSLLTCTIVVVSCALDPPPNQQIDAAPTMATTRAQDSLSSTSDFDRPPELLSMDPAEYPAEARERNIQGTVLIRVLVGRDGQVEKMTILRGVEGLNDDALKAASTARFKPALKGGRPVAVWMVVPLEFTLH